MSRTRKPEPNSYPSISTQKPSPTGLISVLKKFTSKGTPIHSPSSLSAAEIDTTTAFDGQVKTHSFIKSGEYNGNGHPEKRKREGNDRGGDVVNGHRIGGPDGFDELIARLNARNEIHVRIRSAKAITDVLAEYAINDVATIWDLAADMIGDISTPGASEVAYRLLLACIKHKPLTSGEASVFLETVVSYGNRGPFDARFQVLLEITNHGRNLECVEDKIVVLIGDLLRDRFTASTAARRKDRSDLSMSISSVEEQLEQIFQYVLQVLKFNSKIMTESDLEMIIAEVLVICHKTTFESHLTRCIDVVDACVTYAYLPAVTIKPCMAVLCGIYCQVVSLRSRTRQSVTNLMKSHHAPCTMQHLLDILKNGAEASGITSNIIRGAAQLLSAIMDINKEDNFLRSNLALLMSSITGSLQLQSTRLAGDILYLLSILIQGNDVLPSLLQGNLWNDFANVLVECSERIAFRADSHHTATPRTIAQFHSEDGEEFPRGDASGGRFHSILNHLIVTAEAMEHGDREVIMELTTRLLKYLPDATAKLLINYYTRECVLMPWNDDWTLKCQELKDVILTNQNRPASIRILVFYAISDAYMTAQALQVMDSSELAVSMISCLGKEKDAVIIQLIADMVVQVAMLVADEIIFDMLISNLNDFLHDLTEDPSSAAAEYISSPSVASKLNDSCGVIVAKSLVRIFLRTINACSWKAQRLYQLFLLIASSGHFQPDVRITVLKVLARLRSDANHAVYIVPDTQCQGLAAALCRTTETALEVLQLQGSPTVRPQRKEEFSLKLKDPGTSRVKNEQGIPLSEATSSLSRFPKLARPVPPLWMYPGPNGLPENPPAHASHSVFSHQPSSPTSSPSREACFPDQVADLGRTGITSKVYGTKLVQDSANQSTSDTTYETRQNSLVAYTVLDMGDWLNVVLSILQQETPEWEIYSYVLVHIGTQLTNLSLFVDALDQVRALRTIVCNQLLGKSFLEPPGLTYLKKSDVAVCLYHILTILVSYHNHFTLREADEVVVVLSSGIGFWERAASEMCIHGLAICCHELPVCSSKQLVDILVRMQRSIAPTQSVVHVLEFLTGVARMPALFEGFRAEDFRMVFSICLRYLSDVRDKNIHSLKQATGRVNNGTSPKLNGRNSSVIDGFKIRPLTEELPEYVYALAYHVMIFWFMASKLQERPGHVEHIEKNLVYRDRLGNLVMEEQALVTMDIMKRIVYSDRDETAPDPTFSKPVDGAVNCKSWLTGLSIMTIETASRSGVSQITRRRPSGTRYALFRPQLISAPRHQASMLSAPAVELKYSQQYVEVYPDDVIQECYSSFNLSSASPMIDPPVPLPDDEATQRSLSTFDRISPLDGHKVGIIYLGESQDKESDILANVMGSADYTAFLKGIGTLTRLKGATFNTQGLDHEFDSDGEFTFCWRDRVTEIVFHVTTMMPTNLNDDPNCTNKKRHVGNDFVNIIFNNAGQPFSFETLPSEYNYVNIIIAPEARASFIETRLQASRVGQTKRGEEASDDGSQHEIFYKVTVLTKPGLPKISPASETKMVSGKSLPAFVRHLALNASVFCSIWSHREGGEHVSSWLSRLREIQKLRDKHCTARPASALTVTSGEAAEASPTTKGAGSKNSSPVFSATREPNSGILKRVSASPLLSDVTAMRSSSLMSSIDRD